MKMPYVNTTDDLKGLAQMGQENVKKLGKVACEALAKQGKDVKEALAAKFGQAKEDLDIGSDEFYTTAIAAFVEKKLRPELVAEKVIKQITMDTRGKDSIKIPLRNDLITASDLPDSGQVTADTGTYDSTTVTLRYSYAAQTISHELLQVSNVDLIQEELGEIGDAIARKIDSDVISALQAATVTANGNLTSLGGSTEITFSTLVTGRKSAIENYAKPDVLLISPETEATIVALGQFAGTTNVVGALTTQGQNGVTFPVMQSIMGMRVVVSNQVDDDDVYLIDSARLGYLVRNGGVEVFDGRKSGYLAYEVIGAHQYGVGIVQPKAVFRLEENA